MRLISRLADAFEALGDVELAIKYFGEIDRDALPSDDATTTLVLARNRLKLTVYRIAETRNRAASSVSPMLVEMYNDAMIGRNCASSEEMVAASAIKQARDESTAKAAILKQLEVTLQKIQEELAGDDWDAVLKKRRAYCR